MIPYSPVGSTVAMARVETRDQLISCGRRRCFETTVSCLQENECSVFITNSTEQSPWEANSDSASQEIPCLLRNPKVDCGQFRDPEQHFITSCVLQGRVVRSSPKPNAGVSPLVGCLRLLIQYIRSYPPHLEAVSSIRMPSTLHAAVTRPHVSYPFLKQMINA